MSLRHHAWRNLAAANGRWQSKKPGEDIRQIPALPQQNHTATILENNNHFPPPGWGTQPASAFPITAPLDAIATAIVGSAPEIPQKQLEKRAPLNVRARKSYDGAKNRCTNPNNPSFPYYGGRGIEFRYKNFKQFLADMGERPPGLSLDRINNNSHYEPGNCRWATREQQHNNRRDNLTPITFGRTQTIAQWAREIGLSHGTISYRHNKGLPAEAVLNPNRQTQKLLTAFGQTQTLAQWAHKFGLSSVLLYGRIKRGWLPEAALTTPLNPYKTRKDKGQRRKPYRPRTPKAEV
jgi:hypothetical protein